jgi:hypothetical protein
VAQRGEFERIVIMPNTGADVPDELDTRLVVLGPQQAYSRTPGNAAEAAAKAVLESRGSAPRLYRNTLVFAAPDATRLQDLEAAVRDFLAWQSIVAQKDELNLTAHQARQAETQLRTAGTTVQARLPETYQWVLVPVQATPQAPVTWEALKLTGGDPLAVRTLKKLRAEDLLLTSLGGTRLRMDLDKVPLWRGDHVALAQLVQDFASYLYLPRLIRTSVLSEAARSGVALLTWEQDTFAYAESYDADAQRYRGLQRSVDLSLRPDDAGLLVKPSAARQQMDVESKGGGGSGGDGPGTDGDGEGDGHGGEGERGRGTPGGGAPGGPSPKRPKRYYGSVTLNAERVGRDAGQIASEVIAHLTGLVGAEVRVTLEIDAAVPNGVPENVVRIVTENGRTLKFDAQGFESE